MKLVKSGLELGKLLGCSRSALVDIFPGMTRLGFLSRYWNGTTSRRLIRVRDRRTRVISVFASFAHYKRSLGPPTPLCLAAIAYTADGEKQTGHGFGCLGNGPG